MLHILASGLIVMGAASLAFATGNGNLPKITGVSPSSGPTAGGTVVTITGNNFKNGAVVRFGGTNSTHVTFVNSLELLAVSPTHSVGPVSLGVSNPNNQATNLPGGFTYTAAPAPTISQVSPSSGLVSGGTQVTVTGTNFESGATVTFGATAATGVIVTSSTQITAVTPAESAGTVSVTVKNPDGGTATLAQAFTFNALPTVTSVSPSSGSVNGGTQVTVTGTNFESGATVTFGATAATGVTVTSSTQITAVTPAESAGTVSVTVKNPDGGTATLAQGFTFNPSLVLSPTALDFGSQPVGTTSAPQTVVVTNNGGSSVTISSIGLAGADPADFSQNNNCASILSAGSTCNAVVTFSPGATGNRTATISVTDNAQGSPQTAALSGTGAHSVTLNWDGSTGGGQVTGYNVYRGTTSGGETLLTSAGDILTFQDAAVSAGQTYYYEVTATGPGGESGRSNEAIAVVPAP
ncbi:MAG TPA: IPT/TIG domain-containing protein [Terriglobia bacterium]|nr:IPT/TIG domain-containing protein [Terriglobia bacterium]